MSAGSRILVVFSLVALGCASSSPVVGPDVSGDRPRDYPAMFDEIGMAMRAHSAAASSPSSLAAARAAEAAHHAQMATELGEARRMLEDMQAYCHLHTADLALDLRIATDAVRSMEQSCETHARSAQAAPSVDALRGEEAYHTEAVRLPLADAERLARSWRAAGDTHHCWKPGL